MAETPLFEVIVAEIAAMVGQRSPTAAAKTAAVAVHLRQMWNARGAADIAKLELRTASSLAPGA